jgi:outer membrane lipoprotein-sorting protein
VIRALGPLALGLVLLLASGTAGSDARQAVEAFLSRLAGAQVTDLTIQQTLTIYHLDGRRPHSTGEQVFYIKLPQRQRLEQTLEGRREVRLTVGDRTWIRGPDGRTDEAPAGERERDRTRLFTPLPRNADDLLAEWKAFGVRQDVSHVVHVHGRPVTVIGAGPDDRASPAVWLDAEYGVMRVITRERFPPGEALVDLTLSEHRPLVGGFYFPHRHELFANGRLVLRAVVRTASVNGRLPDALYDPEALRQGR